MMLTLQDLVLKWVPLAVLALIFVGVCFLGRMIYQQQSIIAFYEQQPGVMVYPGAKKWILGNVDVYKEYERRRKTKEIVEIITKWIMLNIQYFADKKEDVPLWNPLTLLYVPGKVKLIISDPSVVQALADNTELIDKNKLSFTAQYQFNERFKNNLLIITRSQEQMKRRRTMTNGFSGRQHFKILDQFVDRVLQNFFSKLRSLHASGRQTIDLRHEMMCIFESIMTMYLFDRDISQDQIVVSKINMDGTLSEESQKCFMALNTTLIVNIAVQSTKKWTSGFFESPIQKACKQNWANFAKFIDDLVVKQIEISAKKDPEAEPTCLIDIMLQTDFYEGKLELLSNDLTLALVGGTDTSKNATTIALCHLAKNKKSAQLIRDEVSSYMATKGVDDVMKLGSTDVTSHQFLHLQRVINEGLRFNSPLPVTDEYRIQKDCTLGRFSFKRDTVISFCTHQVHYNPNEWQQPEKYLPERFDPSHELFKTPKGQDRQPMSFIPFSFGERKCLGYQFAKVIIPLLLKKIILNFDFEMADEEFREEHKYPIASMFQNHQLPINVRFTPINQ